MAAPTSEAFRRWFRASKVVDARGEPLVVYHGTRAGFTDFAPGLSDTASRTGVPEGAHYFTASPKVAATYPAETRRRYYEGANIVPVYLSLQNPLVVGYSVPDADLAPSWDRIPFQGRKRTINEIAHYAREHGYDGVIARSIYDRGYGDLPFAQSVSDTYIAFHPTQIKSATGNAGTFDPNDPDIRRNPMNAYNALHAAAGYALQAWMNAHRDEVERRMRAPAAVREYRYGARNRPPGYATVPSGLVRVEPPPFPQEARVRHGVVVYNRPLTDEEVRGYELHPYMPLAEVVDGVIASLGEYAEEAYAPNVREESAEQVRSETGGYLNDHTVYTDIPLAEVYKHVAAELLRRFPAAAAREVELSPPAASRAEDLRVAWESLSSSEMDERLAAWIPVLNMAAKDKEERGSEASEIPLMLSALGFNAPENLADWEVSRLLSLLSVGETTRKKVSRALAVKRGSRGPKWQQVFDTLDENRSVSRADREAQEIRRKLLERVRTELPDAWGTISYLRQKEDGRARAVQSQHQANKRRREDGERLIPGVVIASSVRDRQNAAAQVYEAEEAAIRMLARRNPRAF